MHLYLKFLLNLIIAFIKLLENEQINKSHTTENNSV